MKNYKKSLYMLVVFNIIQHNTIIAKDFFNARTAFYVVL